MYNAQAGRVAIVLVSFCLLILVGCGRPDEEVGLHIDVFNPHSDQWVDAPVTLRLESYSIQPAPFVRVYREHGEARMEIPSQLDDLDQDGTPDRLFFLVNLDAHETARFAIVPDSVTPTYPARAAARLTERPTLLDAASLRQVQLSSDAPDIGRPLPGAIWESERIAYQTAGGENDRPVAIGKSRRALIASAAADDSSNALFPDGATLGLAMPAIATRTGFTPCSAADDVVREIVADGPLRAIVRTRASGVVADEILFDVLTEQEIHAGSRWAEARIRIADTLGTRQLVTGIPRVTASRLESGSVQGRFYIYSVGPQSLQGDSLGIAVLVPSRLHPRLQPTSNDDFRIQFGAENETAVYRYMAAWSGESDAIRPLSDAAIVEEISREAARWTLPVQVSVRR